MLEAADLVQLPKGQAFALIGGGQLYKLRMPLPDSAADPLMPASLNAIGLDIARRVGGSGASPSMCVPIEGGDIGLPQRAIP